MYIVKDYLTNETVAIATRKEDAVAMIQNRKGNDPILIIEKV